MELFALDSNFQILGILDYINLQWNREYYESGSFSVQLPAGGFIPGTKYLYTSARPETGIVQKLELSETVKGKFIQLSGFFLEALLNDKIVFPTFYGSGKLESAVTDMINRYRADLPISVESPLDLQTQAICFQETGGQLGNTAYEKLKTQQLSYYCRYDYLSNTIRFKVWKGTDRTQDQTKNNFVIFSEGFCNLSQADVMIDDSNYKNYAVVAGEGEGAQRKMAVADLSGGGYQKILFVDARMQRWDQEKQSESEYLEALRQYGVEKLADYALIQNIEVIVAGDSFSYLIDFDLGDLVDVMIESLGLQLRARIVAVHEVFKSFSHTITIELGDKTMSQIKKARLS